LETGDQWTSRATKSPENNGASDGVEYQLESKPAGVRALSRICRLIARACARSSGADIRRRTGGILGVSPSRPIDPIPKPIPVAGELAEPKPTTPFAEEPKVKVYVKQECWLVNSIDRWVDRSARTAKKYGMQAWALFKLKPVDGDYEAKTPDGGLELYAFDWKEGMQYWWTCEYEAFEDRMRQEGKQIVIVDEEGHEKALAVYANWGTAETARCIHNLCMEGGQKVRSPGHKELYDCAWHQMPCDGDGRGRQKHTRRMVVSNDGVYHSAIRRMSRNRRTNQAP
jgi:hypothetical protein